MSNETFKDHFSGHAGDYARFRPGYPPALFAWLAGQCGQRELAWDAGTGNGQAAHGLAQYFTEVFATDASAEQISQAAQHAKIRFQVEPAEHCSLPDGSTDLVSVGQALHWFDFDGFHAEVHRVLKPGGLFAAWTYLLNQVTPAVDEVVRRLYNDVVGNWWPPERRWIEECYATLPFPYTEVSTPQFDMRTHADLSQYVDYLRTWSSVRRYMADRKADPLELVRDDLNLAWGEPGDKLEIRWPLVVRAGFNPAEN